MSFILCGNVCIGGPSVPVWVCMSNTSTPWGGPVEFKGLIVCFSHVLVVLKWARVARESRGCFHREFTPSWSFQ